MSARRFAVIMAAAAAGSFVLGTGIAAVALHWFVIIPGREEVRTGLTDFDLQQAQQLRMGKTDSVIEAYEHRVDVYVRGQGREPLAYGREAVAMAAAYRAAHPRKTANTALDETVRRVLEPHAASRP